MAPVVRSSRVCCYARIRPSYPISRLSYSLRAPSVGFLSPAEMIFMMKIWRAEVLELLHPAVAPASWPDSRRSRLATSCGSNAHTTTVGFQPEDRPAALLRGLDREQPALPSSHFVPPLGYASKAETASV